MNRIKLSVRVPASQETMLRHIAEVRGLTRYQALARVVETGLASIMSSPVAEAPVSKDDALASLDSRLSVIEALIDRSLFTASAAYAYARRAALRNDSDAERSDSATSDAAQASYKRQRALAAEALSRAAITITCCAAKGCSAKPSLVLRRAGNSTSGQRSARRRLEPLPFR